MKNKLIAGNWKMNLTAVEAEGFVKQLLPLVDGTANKVVLCVPFTDLKAVAALTKGTAVSVGAQNVHWAASGAFTGEISVEMLKEAEAEYAIVGHSERRQYFNETDATVNKRAKAALDGDIAPIVCVGETLDEREGGKTERVLEKQVLEGLKDFTAEQIGKTVIAYEPIWAIGTGKTATAKDANDTVGFVRSVVAKMFGIDAAKGIYILYGGSMNEKNAKELLCMPEIDGGLVGGASLDVSKFAAIVRN